MKNMPISSLLSILAGSAFVLLLFGPSIVGHYQENKSKKFPIDKPYGINYYEGGDFDMNGVSMPDVNGDGVEDAVVLIPELEGDFYNLGYHDGKNLIKKADGVRLLTDSNGFLYGKNEPVRIPGTHVKGIDHIQYRVRLLYVGNFDETPGLDVLVVDEINPPLDTPIDLPYGHGFLKDKPLLALYDKQPLYNIFPESKAEKD